jgi:murein DD-endopeptidase MepM/ murein hydrolase activator NlpD
MLGDSALVESLYTRSDTVIKKSGGNIISVFRDFIQKFIFQEKEETNIFIKPVNGFISREFNKDKGHNGIDYVVKKETPVYSTADGFIVFADYTIQDGYMIIINHNDAYISIYKHCAVLLKEPRESVQQGELIALSGNTGEVSTGPHLHFEVWKNGQPVDPKSLFYNN